METELNKKEVIYLSKGNTIQLEFIEAFYVLKGGELKYFLWYKFCNPLIQSHQNDGIIYVHFL